MKPDQHRGLPDSRAEFPATSWTLIRKAQAGSEQQRRLLLCQLAARYWDPLYAYYRCKGQTSQDAQDLVQSLLWHLASGDRLAQVPPAARFRHWLMACARNFLLDEQRKANAARRQPQGGLRSLQDLGVTSGRGFEPADGGNPEAAYREVWRRTVLDQALQSTREDCSRKNRALDFEIFLAYYAPDAGGSPTWDSIARQFGVDNAKLAARRADWVKAQLARAIRVQVSVYVESVDEVDEEIRDLLV